MGIAKRSRLLPLLLAAVAISAAGCYGSEATNPPIMPGANLGVPSQVANRTALYNCGKEERPVGNEDYNRDGRQCFWDHNQNKQDAEFITVTSAYQAGTITVTSFITMYYRTYADGHVDIITDGRQSPYIAGWTLSTCKGLDQSSDAPPAPGVIVWNGRECTQTDLLKAGS